VQFIACNALQFFVRYLQTFQRDGKYSWLKHFRLMNIFHHFGEPAIIAEKIAARCMQQLHMKSWH